MPRSCCVPGCRSNYKVSSVSCFKFPNDPLKSQQWVQAIHRENFSPGKYSVVCVKHFDERFVVREDTVRRPDGTLLTVKRDKIKLTDDAIPTIFPDQPSYMNKTLPPQRRDPGDREHLIQLNALRRIQQAEVVDTINSLNDIKKHYSSCNQTENRTYHTIGCENSFKFFFVKQTENDVYISTQLVIDKNLEFKLLIDGILINDNPKVKDILSGSDKINSYKKLKLLLDYMTENNNQPCIIVTTENYINSINVGIDALILEHSEENEICNRLLFFQEQINLTFKRKITYCVNTLLWFATFLYIFPGAYKHIRSAKLFTMPHPKYLATFTFKLGINNSGIESGHFNYLKKKIKLLDVREKYCCLLLDEIYVKPHVTYKAGKIEGLVVNNSSQIEPATTIQAFMISSIFSKYKDVVGLFPVKNLNSSLLLDLTMQILKLLTAVGFKVVCVISDNNRVNRNVFEKLCGGSLKSKFVNPFCNSEHIFVIFDTVHLFKCIRNNWLNQTDPNQTLVFPNFQNNEIREYACISHLKALLADEEYKVVKLAPALSKKVLYPTSIEKQNVSLCYKLFDEKNIAALKDPSSGIHSDTSGTTNFLNIILNWWKVVNVKQQYKWVRFKDDKMKPIYTTEDSNFVYLTQFLNWLESWDNLSVQGEEPYKYKRRGKLTVETQTALKHTVSTLLELVIFLKESLQMGYVLLGKFQTDNLEARFGQYRQMSGACYHISVKQVLESEKKLKAVSLIKLHSAKHDVINLSEIFLPLDTVSDSNEYSNDNNYDNALFDDLTVDLSDINISENDIIGLLYITGYLANVILKNNSCSKCKEFLTISGTDVSSTVLPQNKNYYFNVINRGSLKYPSDFLMSIVTTAFKVFQVVLTDRYESKFLSVKGQKETLISTILEFLELDSLGKCEICNVDLRTIVNKCLNSFSNILLNNYSKNRMDKLTSKKKLLEGEYTKTSKKQKVAKLNPVL